MVRYIFILCKYTCFTVGVFLLHLMLRQILPAPIIHLNILLTTAVLIITLRESGFSICLTFVTHFFMELYSTTPYGLVLSISTLSVLLCLWAYRHFFTNSSWYTVLALSILLILFYQTALTISLIIVGTYDQFWKQLPYQHIFWEMVITSMVNIILFFVLSPFFQKRASFTTS